jgi:2-methylcitrate dehydratase PrpD
MLSESTTKRLADSIVDTTFADISDEAVHVAKRMLLDIVGVAIAGTDDQEFEFVERYISAYGGHGPVAGPKGHRLDVASAALMAGSAAHILDYDDAHSYLGGHPTAPVFSPLVALGYLSNVSGEEFIRALVLGAEVEVRLGLIMNPAHYSIGWHPTSVIGTIGASVTTAALLGLDAEGVRRAIGAAASFASGTKANFGTSMKSIQVAMAGCGGMQAALLAKCGASANPDMLDEQTGGYLDLFTRDPDREAMLAGFGKEYALVDPGVGFKMLPCCGGIQASAWAMIDLFESGQIDPTKIGAIRTYVDKVRIPHTNRPIVTNGLEGKFSSQYCQAVAALTGSLGLSDFEDAMIAQSDRQDLMKRVSLLPAPEDSEWLRTDGSRTGSRGALVEVEDTSGHVVQGYCPGPKGYSDRPASDKELIKKFMDCTHLRPRADAEALVQQIMTLESAKEVAPFIEAIWAE